MSTTDTRAAFGAWWLQTHTFDGPATIEDVARRAFDAGHQAATEAAKATGTAGKLFGYGSSEKKNCLLSKAQFDNCAPKNRTAYDIPLYAYSLPKCEGCKGYGVITHVSGQTPDNYQECNEVCPECEGTGEAARQPAPVVPVKTWHERLGVDPREFGDDTPEELAMLAEITDLRAALLQIQENSDDISAHLKAKNEMVSTLRAAMAATAAPVALDLTEQEISELYAKNGVTPHCFARAIIDAITARTQA